MSRHPSRARLQRWLTTGGPRRVDRHVDDCEQCQGELEELSALDEELVAELSAAVAPPSDLSDRTTGGVQERLRDEAALGVFLDLFSVGWDVARTIADPHAPSPRAGPGPATTGGGRAHEGAGAADPDTVAPGQDDRDPGALP